MSAPYRIVCVFPPDTKHYYWREEQIVDAYKRPKTRPLFSVNLRDAHKFFQEESAIAFRDHFRALYPNRLFIESVSGGPPLFENKGVQPQIDSEDRRGSVWVIPDGCEESQMGFPVVPAFSAHLGRCWAVRAKDIPSVVASGRHSALESVYAADPESAVARARELWGSIMQPFANPTLEAQAREEIRQFVAEIHNQGKTGRPRPGDL